jgi:sialate O-acetylesterase
MGPNTPTALYNGMIAPIAPFGIRGAIWYQGESNRGRADQYARLLPAMIADWRRTWGEGEFPFYYVQIAPYHYGDQHNETALLREAQLKILATPNTGMAVTMDIGNPADIHPANKQDVGRRLALWALSRTYERPGIECSGPLFAGMTRDGNSVRIAFSHATGLNSRGESIKGFQIAGADKVFVGASSRIDGDAVVVWSDAVGAPAAVRYGWGEDIQPNLFNGVNLPAAPFRTDDWPQ